MIRYYLVDGGDSLLISDLKLKDLNLLSGSESVKHSMQILITPELCSELYSKDYQQGDEIDRDDLPFNEMILKYR